MKFQNNNRKWGKSIRHFSFFILIMVSFEGIAQTNFSKSNIVLNSSNNQVYKVISFGEKIDFGMIENSARWTIANNKENIAVSLSGSQINDYIFEKPGIYEISFFENVEHSKGKCNHPPFQEKMIIKVNALKMTFDFSTIKFSESIVGGKELQNAEVSVEVDFKSYKNKNESPVFSKARVSVAGVGATIIGSSPNDTITLTSGRQKIVYQLNGTASRETYIMFDFFDINGQAQSYYYPNKL
ncbi:hypothetical protein [Flavobacterium alvei]|uniref:hypothetical protein n=1 Tax=Flavobacterium alvei TaxID=2080416 RepID=UPI0026EE3302|nr:hypothetical protein [Flavobacterium alvei]